MDEYFNPQLKITRIKNSILLQNIVYFYAFRVDSMQVCRVRYNFEDRFYAVFSVSDSSLENSGFVSVKICNS